MSFNKKKVIIDTDCGLDDAMAIMIASECEEADIIAITCVHGNTTVDNVAVNVCRTLETCGDLQVGFYDVPYSGDMRRPSGSEEVLSAQCNEDCPGEGNGYIHTWKLCFFLFLSNGKQCFQVWTKLKAHNLASISFTRRAVLLRKQFKERPFIQGDFTALGEIAPEVILNKKVPIYKGAGLPILGHFSLADSTSFHGKDGFGDVEGLPIPNTVNTLIQKDHAVDKLISLARLFPGEITLIAMAPLTNIALAIRKDPSFSKNIRELVLMGGNSQGEGNITVSAEANFYIDPEAAYIVLNEMQSPIAMVPWELCIRQYIDWDWRDKLLESPSKKAKLMKTIEHGIREKSDFTGYILCDQFAVIAALKPDMVKVKNGPFHVSVELFGHYTRGQAIIDKHDKLKARKNVQIIEEFQMEDLKHLLTTVFA